MITSKTNVTTTVTAKGVIVVNNHIIDSETGEDLISILSDIYGDEPFNITAKVAVDKEAPISSDVTDSEEGE